MGLFSRKKPEPERFDPPGWIGVVGAGMYQAALRGGERAVEVELRLLKGSGPAEVSVYVNGRKAGELNARNSEAVGAHILEVAPDTRRVRTSGRVVAEDGGRFYGVRLERPGG